MASTSMDPLTEDYRCVYCLQRLPYMVDPRQLPCSHVFCLSCLKADFAEISTTRCQICSKTHEIEDLDTLSAAGNTTTGEDKSTKLLTKVLCDVCTGHRSISITYCCDCKKHYCEEHHKMHDVILGSDHSMVCSDTGESVTSTCQQHTTEALTLACSVCHKTFCTSCDTESGCEECPAGHEILKLDELANKLRGEMNAALKTFSDQITEDIKEEKCDWTCLGDIETKVEEMRVEVDRVAKQKILAIQQTSTSIKRDLRQYLQEAAEETESQTAHLMSSIANRQDLWRPMSQLVKTSDLNIIQLQRKSVEAFKKGTDAALVKRKRKYPESTLNSINVIKQLKSPLVNHSVCPTSVELLKECSGTYHCVSWTNEGSLVAGGTELSVFTRKLDKLKSCVSSTGTVTSVIEMDKKFSSLGVVKYATVTKSETDAFQVRFNSSSFNDGNVLYKSQQPAYLAFHPLTSRIIASIVGTHSYGRCQLSVLSHDGALEYTACSKDTCSLSSLSGIHCLPDGAVLVSLQYDNKPVRKYYIDSATKELVLVWECKGISRSTGISSDSAGHIYVGSESDICIISPSGAMLQKITLRRYGISFVRDVAVTGTLMAVANGDGKILLFNLVRQPPEG